MAENHHIPELIEGRLLAQRQVLAALVAAVIDERPETLSRLRRLVTRDAVAADQAEDPGAVPDGAFAIEAAAAEEIRLIAERVASIRSVRPT